VLSLDYALPFEGVPAERQPGVNVRRIPGVEGRASDEQLLDYHGTLFATYGGHVRARWDAGAAVATPAGPLERTTIPAERTFGCKPSARRIEGYPLASLQLAHDHIYISEPSDRDEEHLWQRSSDGTHAPLSCWTPGRRRRRLHDNYADAAQEVAPALC
jgi:hypothetical protein